MSKRPLLPDNIAPGWLVVHVFGTLMIGLTLVTARETSPWVWGSHGVVSLCWLVFLVAEYRKRPSAAAVVLGLGALAAGLTVSWAADPSALIFCMVLLGRFAALVTPAVTAIASVALACAAFMILPYPLSRASAGEVLGNALLVLAIVLLGLNRRQYEVQAIQAERLLVQTRLAQAEHSRAAALDERTRIAREIHDVLAHSLGALGVQLELAEALLAEKSDLDSALATVRRSRRLAADGLSEARDAVAALRRDVPSLTEALRSMAAAHSADHQVPVEFEAVGEARPISSAATVSLAGTAREALTNAAKHAPGRPVTMSLEFTAGAVRLRVYNELPGQPVERAGHGLTGMRERLALAGGTLSAGPAGSGWRLVAEVGA
ncbi:sensor histidine kinase [Amycolatopsis nigrescens]|uniref:sensor histidine kinase n=1 Tax=Amycolatopsis nigrescens TaxID=381445 RepID=UPI0003776402|nr:histidine kinase [Amycolatopsis nigrescens]